jgi:hypothetical protein
MGAGRVSSKARGEGRDTILLANLLLRILRLTFTETLRVSKIEKFLKVVLILSMFLLI